MQLRTRGTSATMVTSHTSSDWPVVGLMSMRIFLDPSALYESAETHTDPGMTPPPRKDTCPA